MQYFLSKQNEISPKKDFCFREFGLKILMANMLFSESEDKSIKGLRLDEE